MQSLEINWSKQDVLLLAAAFVGIVILASSIIWLFITPYGDKDKAAAYKEIYDVVVKSTLMPLFTTLLASKVAYAVGIAFTNRNSRDVN